MSGAIFEKLLSNTNLMQAEDVIEVSLNEDLRRIEVKRKNSSKLSLINMLDIEKRRTTATDKIMWTKDVR